MCSPLGSAYCLYRPNFINIDQAMLRPDVEVLLNKLYNVVLGNLMGTSYKLPNQIFHANSKAISTV